MNPWNAAELQFDASSFSGVARLFPLPNLVLYPHVMQPLHIFEPRYREMLEDAVHDDGLIAMGLLEPGWETDYEGRPPVSPYACLGKIVTHHRLEDGRYNLLLLGVHRVRVVREVEPPRCYRRAAVELLEDCYHGISSHELDRLNRELLEAFQRVLPASCQGAEQLPELLSEQAPLGLLTDLAAYTLPLDIALKQQLLAECRVAVRAKTLLAEMEKLSVDEAISAATIGFPPPFSVN
jgi:uncharacterized protein